MDRQEILKRIDTIRQTLATRDRPAGYWTLKLERILPALERVLAKIDSGTYGTCDDCGQDIEATRLQAAPGATRCLECQQMAEKQLRNQ